LSGPISKPTRTSKRSPRPVIGWREWLALPDLGVERIKAKVDTGARTSALHAFDIHRFERGDEPWVRFLVHPVQRETRTTVAVECPLVGERLVRSSDGRRTRRPVIRTRVCLGSECWPIEVTLVRRDLMGFRMLLGRQAIRGRFVVDPGRSYRGEKAGRRAPEEPSPSPDS
jgi:hypothetical protein